MNKQEISVLKDAIGTLSNGVDMLEKFISTSEQQMLEGTDEEDPKDPRKKDPDNHPDEEKVEKRIAFCKAVLDDDETTNIVGICVNSNTHEVCGRVNLNIDLLKEMAKLYMNAHE